MNNETAVEEAASLKHQTLLWALILGVLGDLLLRAGPIGPGLVLWVGVASVGAIWLARRADVTRWPVVAGWSAVALVAAVLMVMRAHGFLHFLLFLLLPLVVSQVLMLSWGARLGRSMPLDHLYAMVLVPVKALFGAAPLLAGVSRGRGRVLPRVVSVGRGLVFALPLLWVFIGLLSAADAGFNRLADQAFELITVPNLTRHLVVVLMLTWVIGGWLHVMVAHDRENLFRRIPLPSMGRDETLIVLGSLTLLFGGFVVLQLGYLFGGQAVIQNVAGLTMAEYARRGFFELVTIAGLMLGVLLFAGAVTKHQRLYRTLAWVLVGLLLVMLVSATQRFVLYIGAFGLSLDRLTVLAILFWLAFTLVYFALTVLKRSLNRFASGSVLAAVVMVFVFALMNPAAMVARVNLERTIQQQQPLDTYYLLSLGADAVPTILSRLDLLPEAERCELAEQLLSRWSIHGSAQSDWRVWNAAKAKTYDQVARANLACKSFGTGKR